LCVKVLTEDFAADFVPQELAKAQKELYLASYLHQYATVHEFFLNK
jgi:hypothetical protein